MLHWYEIITYLLTLIFFGCASTGGTRSSILKLETAESIQIKNLNKAEILQLLGNPDETTNWKDIPYAKATGETWEYHQDGYTRLSISFEKDSIAPKEVTWEVKTSEPEQDLKVALGRYPKAKWTVELATFTTPHHVPDECIFEDRKIGVSVVFRRTRQEVSSISRWNLTNPPTKPRNKKSSSDWNAVCELPKWLQR